MDEWRPPIWSGALRSGPTNGSYRSSDTGYGGHPWLTWDPPAERSSRDRQPGGADEVSRGDDGVLEAFDLTQSYRDASEGRLFPPTPWPPGWPVVMPASCRYPVIPPQRRSDDRPLLGQERRHHSHPRPLRRRLTGGQRHLGRSHRREPRAWPNGS